MQQIILTVTVRTDEDDPETLATQIERLLVSHDSISWAYVEVVD